MKFNDWYMRMPWIKTCLADHQPGLGEADYSIVSGVLRGLLIDFLETGDHHRTTTGFQAFLDGFRFSLTSGTTAGT